MGNSNIPFTFSRTFNVRVAESGAPRLCELVVGVERSTKSLTAHRTGRCCVHMHPFDFFGRVAYGPRRRRRLSAGNSCPSKRATVK